MNTLSVSRLALALAFGVTLSACSSTHPIRSLPIKPRLAPPRAPILSANEAKNFVAARYFCLPDAEYRPVVAVADYPARTA
ncbi:pectinesterase [Salmonella enterica subsp. enterica]|uniref:Pectinesterase n=1 Tax=Salmonella enterica I TaxID=59201 RepID=A0A447MVR0_SALET|nr:pectinesterase [Salmonella enterica subsp. enterica]